MFFLDGAKSLYFGYKNSGLGLVKRVLGAGFNNSVRLYNFEDHPFECTQKCVVL